jgi:hypothetical protein
VLERFAMSSHFAVLHGARRAPVVPDAHQPVARARQGVKKFGVIAIAMTALFASGCFGSGGTYCQSGPKYGTQCYSVQGEPGTNAPPNGNGSIYPVATNSQRTPNGQKP